MLEVTCGRSTGWPSTPRTAAPPAVTVARSPSSRWMIRSVNGASARASDPIQVACSPMPIVSGQPCRTAKMQPGARAMMAATAKAPFRRAKAASAAASGDRPRRRWKTMRWAIASESVSVSNAWPASVSSARSDEKFSTIPLCTIATSALPCGCAFVSLGTPCVAQRVWAMPVSPAIGASASTDCRLATRPAARRRSTRPSSSVAMPHES